MVAHLLYGGGTLASFRGTLLYLLWGTPASWRGIMTAFTPSNYRRYENPICIYWREAAMGWYGATIHLERGGLLVTRWLTESSAYQP